MNKYNDDFYNSIDKYFNEVPVGDVWDFASSRKKKEDMVNHPKHYTSGRFEAIEVIEDAITGAPTVKAGFLLGQVLKYCLRLWGKGNAIQDARKARWYLDRLIDTLSGVKS